MTIANVFEWLGVISGIAGAFLLGSKKAAESRYRFIGFCLFGVSNIAWITFGLMTNMMSILTLQAAFGVTTIRGLINNWK
jgi:hypothetical protein